MLCGSVNSRLNSEHTQSLGMNQLGHMGGPQAHISPMVNFRKAVPTDDSLKPTSSSEGPSNRLQATISPTNQLNSNNQNRCNQSRSSRNSGFKPLQSLQNIDCQTIFNRKHEFIGSVVSNSSQPLTLG